MKEKAALADEKNDRRLFPSRFDSRYYHLCRLREAIKVAVHGVLRDKKGLRLIDLGCGGAPYKSLFCPYLSAYVGMDLSSNIGADIHGNFSQGLPIRSDVADIVLSTQVLEHVEHPHHYLAEVVRVLKKGGYLFLSTHGYWMFHPDPHDYWRWTSEGLKRIVTEARLEIVYWKGIMGLSSAGLQLFQDGIMEHFPGWARKVMIFILQSIMSICDRWFTGVSLDTDASVFLLVAKKT